MNDRSNEALLARRAKAEAATPGPWRYEKNGGSGPGVKTYIIRDSRDWPVGSAYDMTIVNEQNAAHIAANDPGTVIEDINEILRLRAENARLDREADWLADQMHKTLVIDGKHKSKCVFGKDEWREAAWKATENPAQEVKQDAKSTQKWAWAKG